MARAAVVGRTKAVCGPVWDDAVAAEIIEAVARVPRSIGWLVRGEPALAVFGDDLALAQQPSGVPECVRRGAPPVGA